jgi:hypothetical protein
MIDYILTVAAGISSGVGALISAVPGLQPHTLELCLGTLLVLTPVNLQAVREAGGVFILLTYPFIGTLPCLSIDWSDAETELAGVFVGRAEGPVGRGQLRGAAWQTSGRRVAVWRTLTNAMIAGRLPISLNVDRALRPFEPETLNRKHLALHRRKV